MAGYNEAKEASMKFEGKTVGARLEFLKGKSTAGQPATINYMTDPWSTCSAGLGDISLHQNL